MVIFDLNDKLCVTDHKIALQWIVTCKIEVSMYVYVLNIR